MTTAETEPAAPAEAPDQIPRRPLLVPWRECAFSDERVILTHAGSAVVFEGRASRALLPHLLPLLDGGRDVDRIVAELGHAVRPAVEAALRELHAHGLLTEGLGIPSGDPDHAKAALDLSEATRGALTPEEVERHLKGAALYVVGDGGVADQITSLTVRTGVGTVTRVPEEDAVRALPGTDSDQEALSTLVVVAPVSSRAPVLAAVNSWALEEGRAWMQVLGHDGAHAMIGPVFLPGETACHECFRIRRRATLEHGSKLREFAEAADEGGLAPAREWHGAAHDAAVAGPAARTAAWNLLPRSAAQPPLASCVTTLEWNALGLHAERHRVHRVPRCPACSRVRAQGHPQPWFELLPEENR